MKPFDLEKAKAGSPVCTRSGEKVRIICFDANTLLMRIEKFLSPLLKEGDI